jgi:RES domain-containing protein
VPHRTRDPDLIDALAAIPAAARAVTIYRAVREGRDPTTCSASGGRWDDGTFDVLYTSCERDGATAEIIYHLRRGQPVVPTKVAYRLYALSVNCESLLDLSDPARLMDLGVDMNKYGQISYDGRHVEYTRTQDIGEVAHFLDHDGLLVPSARWNCSNLVIFCDHIAPDAVSVVADHGQIDWAGWTV